MSYTLKYIDADSRCLRNVGSMYQMQYDTFEEIPFDGLCLDDFIAS
jgi:hypothetical protein